MRKNKKHGEKWIKNLDDLFKFDSFIDLGITFIFLLVFTSFITIIAMLINTGEFTQTFEILVVGSIAVLMVERLLFYINKLDGLFIIPAIILMANLFVDQPNNLINISVGVFGVILISAIVYKSFIRDKMIKEYKLKIK